MPAHRRLLPRPCPQCGRENGGIQIVIFNPEYNLNARGHGKQRTYAILRISHYSKENYALTGNKLKSKRTKIWHNFQIELPWITIDSESIRIDEIFNKRILRFKQSVTIGVDESFYENVRNHGWGKIVTEKAHWVGKSELKKCDECHMYFKNADVKRFNYPKGYWILKFSCLCESCFAIDLERVAEWKERRLLTGKIQNRI